MKGTQFPVALLLVKGSHKIVRTTRLPVSPMIRLILSVLNFHLLLERQQYVTHPTSISPPLSLSHLLSHSLSLYLSFLLTFQQARLIIHAVDFTLCHNWFQHLRFD